MGFRRIAAVAGPAAVIDAEEDHQERHEQADRAAKGHHKEKEQIDLLGRTRGLLWVQGDLADHGRAPGNRSEAAGRWLIPRPVGFSPCVDAPWPRNMPVPLRMKLCREYASSLPWYVACCWAEGPGFSQPRATPSLMHTCLKLLLVICGSWVIMGST